MMCVIIIIIGSNWHGNMETSIASDTCNRNVQLERVIALQFHLCIESVRVLNQLVGCA